MSGGILPVTDLKQWEYCPRIVYYSRFMAGCGRATYKMREAVSAQEMIEKLELRRGLSAYGLTDARRRFNLWLSDESLGLQGRVDLLLEGADRRGTVVDFKLTSGELGANLRMQLAAYSLLAERSLGLRTEFALVYRIPDGELLRVDVDETARQRVADALRGIREMAEREMFPGATPDRGKCKECEYANYCADLW